MENKKNRKGIITIAIIAAIISLSGGCVASINIQKNNCNSNQGVEQHNKSKIDSTRFNIEKLW